MNSFTNTIVLHVERPIQSCVSGLKHSRACGCSISQVAWIFLWICDIYIQPVVGIWELHIMLELIEKLWLESSLQN